MNISRASTAFCVLRRAQSFTRPSHQHLHLPATKPHRYFRSMAQDIYTNGSLQPKKVSFPSGDGHVVAHLYLPPHHNNSKRYPGVAIAGPFSTVKEQVGGTYASQLARKHDIIALSIDYRNYGESSGNKRQYEDPASKSQDLSAAVSYLNKRPDVSGAGLLGICTSGGNVLYAAAQASHAQAVATVAGFFTDSSVATMLFGGQEGIDKRLAAGRAAQEKFDSTGEIETIRAYHNTDLTAASVSSADYYMDKSRGGGVAAWRNAFAVMAREKWIKFDPISQAGEVTAPTLIVHSEGAAFPDQARKVYEALKGEKELVWAEGGHFDFYDVESTVSEAAERVAKHFHKMLQ
ncbi:uncharacterized protein CLAFUR5_07516 [Fulvia fulva]|uniref:Xaa-Pro dipeptidyl-peptidase-like domain-containing protein n=1 Tax=Passalora fulva TaxID=5499 RepID=A0A9Q8LIV8_PASFU|nr:uncharacterized protein CLAFUR5_07516 [Fulvia fulva]KAK4622552.1 hypothetical protein CLAFUR0_07392 [Fulvia fulva]UJO18456.1 hypothetical protein CLAFUR5_07516 [Fulvia fulva]WPV31665.1 hypothetical protein CLAFUW7_07389 [Fulvia fulva]